MEPDYRGPPAAPSAYKHAVTVRRSRATKSLLAVAAHLVRLPLLLMLAAGVALLAAELATTRGSAGNEGALDQEQPLEAGAIGIGEAGVAQTITPGVSGLMDRVEVLVHVRPRPCTSTLTRRNVLRLLRAT